MRVSELIEYLKKYCFGDEIIMIKDPYDKDGQMEYDIDKDMLIHGEDIYEGRPALFIKIN